MEKLQVQAWIHRPTSRARGAISDLGSTRRTQHYKATVQARYRTNVSPSVLIVMLLQTRTNPQLIYKIQYT
jgi:hypothetical protein